jgi:hypothetical protein
MCRDDTAEMRWSVLSLVCLLVATGGCDQIERELQRRCDQAEQRYQSELDEEKTELAGEEALPEKSSRPAHFGLTLSNGLLSRLADGVVGPAITGVLELASTVRINGQSVNVEADGDVVDLSLAAHDACDHCFEVGVEFGGGIVASIPGIGERRADLRGGGALVAPLILEEGDAKSAAVKLDLGQLARTGASSIDVELGGISEEWRQRLQGPVSRLIERRVSQRLGALTLVEFDGPSFGLEGFELTPVVLESDADAEAVFAGFSANVAALNEESVPGVEPVTELGEGQDIALSFQPRLVVEVLSLLIDTGEVARRYTSDGKASERGGFHVTLDEFGFESADTEVGMSGKDVGRGSSDAGVAGADAGTDTEAAPGLPASLAFGVHQFGDSGLCFSTTAQMVGGVAVRDQNLEMSIDDVRLTGSGVPAGVLDLANWTSAQFIDKSRTLVDQSFAGGNVDVPGTSLDVGPLAVGLRPNTVVLRGKTEGS